LKTTEPVSKIKCSKEIRNTRPSKRVLMTLQLSLEPRML